MATCARCDYHERCFYSALIVTILFLLHKMPFTIAMAKPSMVDGYTDWIDTLAEAEHVQPLL
eukprot:scaffold3216_cov30-Tisochrysis_lutea.AAC.1